MRSGGWVKERYVFSKATLCIFQVERMEERQWSSLYSEKQNKQKINRGVDYNISRIIAASFSNRNKNTNLNLVQKYAPKNRRPEDNKGAFYQKLQTVSDRLPKKDVNLSMGDANANIDSDNTGYEKIIGKHGFGDMCEHLQLASAT